MGRLTGKVAIVTGASRGQGAEEARLFVQEGAHVVLGDVMDEEGRKLADQLGERACYVHLDVSQEADWVCAVEAAEAIGPLNVLVNNAAIQEFRSIIDTGPDEYLRIVHVNQLGTFLGIRAAVEPMKRAGGGSIVNISSVDGLQAKNGIISYVATKWAIRGMTKAAALELGHHGIRVNSIHPGGIDTPMGNPTATPDIDQFYKNQAIPRCGRPEEIARMALFVASDEASYSTGSEFVADGGLVAGYPPPGSGL